MTEQDQRRRFPRIPTQQSVWVEGQDVRVTAQAKNISRGGMFVVSEGAPPEIGTMLQIRFEDPHEGEVELKMEVVWRDETTVTSKLGLRAVDSTGMEAFERVVTRREAEVDADDPPRPRRASTPDRR